MPTSTKWGIRYPAGGDTPPDVPLWMSRMATDLDDVAKDLTPTAQASRPAASKSGRWHKSTDSGLLARDNGSSWEEIIRGSDARLTDTRVPTNGSVDIAKMAAATASRLLFLIPLSSYNLSSGSPSADVMVPDRVQAHNNKACVVVAFHYYQYGSGSGNFAFKLQMDGVDRVTFSRSPLGSGDNAIAVAVYNTAVLNGNHTWNVQITGGGTLIAGSDGNGLIACFEQY